MILKYGMNTSEKKLHPSIPKKIAPSIPIKLHPFSEKNKKIKTILKYGMNITEKYYLEREFYT